MQLLVINPGSTSTKIAVYSDSKPMFEETLRHPVEELSKYSSVAEQFDFRKQVILECLKKHGIDLNQLDGVVGRGGLLRPISGGTYRVNDAMLRDLREAKRGEHASNLGGILAHAIASEVGIQSFIVDPVVVDEMEDISRISGHPQIERKSIFHALNQKAVARRAARELGKNYDEINVIVAHMGGGVSVGLHRLGRVVDVNNALDGEGPFSPERSGGLPVGDLARLCFSGEYSLEEIKRLIKGRGGLVAYLGTNDGREVVERIKQGDDKAKLIYEAMAYQIGKEIGGLAAANRGQIDAIILTGGLAYDSEYLVPWIRERVSFIAPVYVYPGEGEMEALAEGAMRVLSGEEQALEY